MIHIKWFASFVWIFSNIHDGFHFTIYNVNAFYPFISMWPNGKALRPMPKCSEFDSHFGTFTKSHHFSCFCTPLFLFCLKYIVNHLNHSNNLSMSHHLVESHDGYYSTHAIDNFLTSYYVNCKWYTNKRTNFMQSFQYSSAYILNKLSLNHQ